MTLLFLVAVAGELLSLPLLVLEASIWRSVVPTVGSALGILYLGRVASFAAYLSWNRAVAELGANIAGFSIHLLPAFGTVLAMIFLGEEVRPYHLAGIATILAGVALATRRR